MKIFLQKHLGEIVFGVGYAVVLVILGFRIVSAMNTFGAPRTQFGQPGIYTNPTSSIANGQGTALGVDSVGNTLLSTTTALTVTCTNCSASGAAFTGRLGSPNIFQVTDGTTTSTLTANSIAIATSSVNLSGTFLVDSLGDIFSSGTERITGLTNNTGGFTSGASSSIGAGLQVAGALNASSTLLVNSLATLTGGFIASASSSIGAGLNVSGNMNVSSSLFVSSSLIVGQGPNFMGGSLLVDGIGNLTASGTIQGPTIRTGTGVSAQLSGAIVRTQSSGNTSFDMGNSTLNGTNNIRINMDSGNGSTVRNFSVAKGSIVNTGTELFRVNEDGSMIGLQGGMDFVGTVSTTVTSSAITVAYNLTTFKSGQWNVDASGNSSASGTLTVFNGGSFASSTGSTSVSSTGEVRMTNLPTNAVTDDFLCWGVTGANSGRVTHETANCTISSARFKEHIASLSAQQLLAEALKLRPIKFDWIPAQTPASGINGGGKESTGFLAEEVAVIDPMLVVFEEATPESLAFEQKNYPNAILRKNGKVLIPKTIDYARVSYVTVGAIQALDARVTSLEKKPEKTVVNAVKDSSTIEKILMALNGIFLGSFLYNAIKKQVKP